MTFYKIIVGICTFIYAYYIFTFSASYFNDDSLFLANGILNFSIIDFSPHFPGYASIVILGQILNIFINDNKESLFILSSLCGIFLPFVIFLYVEKLKNETSAFIAFILTISSVYLLNITLSMLSESVGLFFFFLSLYLLENKNIKTSGVFFSIAFFARPSYLVFYLLGLVYVYFFKKEALKSILISFFLTSTLFLIYIFAINGLLFIYEAERFVLGHFSLWGRGQNSDITWIDNIFVYENILFVFLFLLISNFDKKFLFIYILFISYFLWVISAQNPDNLRHLVPLVIFANILLSSVLQEYKKLVFLMFVFNISILFSYNNKISPIDQIIKEIKDDKRIILTNRSIEILRVSLTNRIFDNYYVNSSAYYKKNRKSYTITTKKLEDKDYKVFKGRFLGEHDFYLFEN